MNLVTPWFVHGGQWYRGSTTGEFAFTHNAGFVINDNGSRLVNEDYNIKIFRSFYE